MVPPECRVAASHPLTRTDPAGDWSAAGQVTTCPALSLPQQGKPPSGRRDRPDRERDRDKRKKKVERAEGVAPGSITYTTFRSSPAGSLSTYMTSFRSSPAGSLSTYMTTRSSPAGSLFICITTYYFLLLDLACWFSVTYMATRSSPAGYLLTYINTYYVLLDLSLLALRHLHDHLLLRISA